MCEELDIFSATITGIGPSS